MLLLRLPGHSHNSHTRCCNIQCLSTCSVARSVAKDCDCNCDWDWEFPVGSSRLACKSFCAY